MACRYQGAYPGAFMPGIFQWGTGKVLKEKRYGQIGKEEKV